MYYNYMYNVLLYIYSNFKPNVQVTLSARVEFTGIKLNVFVLYISVCILFLF